MAVSPTSVTTHPVRLIRLNTNGIALIAVVLLDVLMAAFVAQQIVAYRDYPFDWDEAFHANNGLALALDLRAGNLGALISEAYQQGYYPPAFSWLRALAFAIFGASPLVGRMFSLACLCAAAPVIYAVGLELDKRFGWLIGLSAVGLTLTSQAILVESALVMMEAPGLLISFATLWSYLRALNRPSTRWLMSVSLLMTLTFLTKYSYGLAVMATIGVMEATRVFVRDRPIRPWRALAGRWLKLFGPFALALFAWFAKPYKIEAFVAYLMSQPPTVARFSVENLIFYPRSIVLHYAPSPLFALLMLAAVAGAAARWRDERLRLLLFYVAIGILEMTINSQKNPRFIATFVPAAYVLTGALLARLASVGREGSLRVRVTRVTIAAVLTVAVISSVPILTERFAALPSLMEVAYETDPRANDLAAWIVAQVPTGQRLYLINPWDQFSGPALAWNIAASRPQPNVRLADAPVLWAQLQRTAPNGIENLRQVVRAADVRYVVVLEGGPEGDPIWSEYARALGNTLALIAQQDIVLEQYDLGAWLKNSPLTREELEQVKSARRYTLHIRATVYQVMQ